MDIYSNFSVIVSELQCVNRLPFERYDKHIQLCEDMKKMILTLCDHSHCDNDCCFWPKLHKRINDIVKGKFPGNQSNQTSVISSDEGTLIYFTRSVKKY